MTPTIPNNDREMDRAVSRLERGWSDYRAVLRRTERLDPVTRRPVWPLKRAGER